MKISQVTAIFLLIFLFCFSAESKTVEKIVATVNGKSITLIELDKAMDELGPKIKKNTGAGGKNLRAKVLNELIDQKILEIKMTESGVKIEPHEIDAHISRITRGTGMSTDQLANHLLEKEGMTLSEYKEQLHKRLLRNKFISQTVGRKISISEQELRSYFEKNMDKFRSSSTAKLAQIILPFTNETTNKELEDMNKYALKISKEMERGNNIELLISKHSGKPYTIKGGEVGVVNIDDLNPRISQVVMQLDTGKVSSPIVTQSGIQIIKVLDRAKTSPKDFARARDQVHDILYNKKMEQTLKGYLKQQRKEAHIEIKGF